MCIVQSQSPTPGLNLFILFDDPMGLHFSIGSGETNTCQSSPVCGVTRMGPCLASREQSCTTSAGVPPACHVSGVISHVSRARKTCPRVSPRVTKFRQFGPRGLQQSSAFWRQLGRRGGHRYCPQLHKYKSYSDIFLFCL